MQILPKDPLKRPSQSGNLLIVIFLTLDAPNESVVNIVLAPHHFDVYFGFGTSPQSYVLSWSGTPRLIVFLVDWAT